MSAKAVNATLKKVSSSNDSTNLLFGQLSSAVDFDFDGDSKADIARWHASNTEWKVKNSSNGNYQTLTIGSASAVIAPGDFDGDGTMDAATFNAGTWTIRKSSNAQTITVSFGSSGDKPVAGDYDGDGTSDPAIFRPSTNTWWILKSSNASTVSVSFGATGDIPVQGKFDADAVTDVAVFRPSTGAWHIQGSTSGYYTVTWGNYYDIPVPADYTGDGKTDLAVYRGAVGTWYVLKSEDYSSYLTQGWGNYGDQPVPADYDGDGKADYSVWRPTTGTWYTIKSSNSSYDYQTLGVAGDTAISSAYLKQIGGIVYSYDFAKVRLSPKNSTGGTDLYSRNFGWSTGLVGLPGRAGLDAGFGISYNSLIWTKDAATNTIVFDADNSNMTPGFRMGFPTIEPVYYDAQTGKFAYMMVAPSGARVEFRQTAATNVYETADSSYTQLKINSTTDPNNPGNPNAPAENLTITVTNTNGTNMLYDWKNGAYRLQKITDRNGNYVEVSHNTEGQLQTVTDTLGRVITVNYTDGLPSSITQDWKSSNGTGSTVTRTYATFTYTTQAITTNFSGSPTVVGPGGGYAVKVLQKITFPTESNGAGPNTVFTYNTWGQVTKVTNYAADNSSLNYVRTNLPADSTTSQADCPRFTETYTQAANFNGGNEVTIKNTFTENVSYTLPNSTTLTGTRIEIKTPDGNGNADRLVTKIFSASSGWAESLPLLTEDWAYEGSGLVKKRWTTAVWTQDDTSLSYIQNPRVEESKVGDDSNTQLTKAYYEKVGNTNVAKYGRVSKVEVYDATGTAVWKQIDTVYNDNSAYLSRRMVNLPTSVKVFGYEQSDSQFKLVSFNTLAYDEGDFSDSGLEQNISSVIRHDTSFSSSFIVGRGNLTSMTRCDATFETICTNGITSSMKYNIAGGVVAQISPAPNSATRQIKISYTDSFNDTTTTRNTYAYPTTVTDPGNYSSQVKYRFDTGANVWAKSPTPSGNSTGKETTRYYDSYGRLEVETLLNNGAYTRYEYPTNNIQSKAYTTLIDNDTDGADADDEVLSEAWTDGAGRVLRSRTLHPGSTGGWTGSLVEYNVLGQIKRSTVPTEISVSNANNPNSWTPAGDDNRGLDGNSQPVWLWKSQEYDWKGRVTRSIPTDSNGSDGKDQLISYDGCGCAGGQVTTIQSELVPRDDVANTNARRTQKIYEDILGRAYKTEVLGWDGSTVYTTTLQTFNGRDQIVNTRQYAGTTASSTFQDVTMTYDGYGRLKTRHYPIEDSGKYTTWDYNADDSVQQVTDPRGVETEYTYNERGLVTGIDYTLPNPNSTNIPSTPSVDFVYDGVGNRTQMTTAGVSEINYVYDDLSRMTSETVDFDSSISTMTNKTISYTYHMGGGLKSITDPFSSTINYTNDKTGRVTAVKGTSFGDNTTGNYADNIKYRAFGQVKQIDYNMKYETPQVKLEYDNRLRVNHSEVTKSGGYLMKADFAYFADSRLQAKDDLIDSKWDRTMKYDFAGRLTFNQFALGLGTDNLTWKRVYEQSVSYDAFSQITARVGEHWDTGIGFSASYVNGRTQESGVNFDASGNIVRKNIDTNTYQETTFDASGRKTAYLDSIMGPHAGNLNIIRQTKSSYVFDGSGSPVMQKTEYRQHHVNDPAPAMTEQSKRYQIWSSVLGSSLTSILADGTKDETRVFAGGALIARQKAEEIVEWTTSDPVTGTVLKLTNYNQGVFAVTEETEPMGQTVSPHDPTELPEPYAQTILGSAYDMQWQCKISEEYYGTFVNMPDRCGGAIYQPKGKEKPANPHKVNPSTAPPASALAGNNFSMGMISFALKSTIKKKIGDDEDPNRTFYVTIEDEQETIKEGPSLPADFKDASSFGTLSFGGGITDDTKDTISAVRAILSSNSDDSKDCRDFFGPNALVALDAFAAQLIAANVSRIDSTDDIGIKQDNPRGTSMRYFDEKGVETKGYVNAAFRLFGRVQISTLGPFNNPLSDSDVGGYPATSRESRITQILHELAHIILKKYEDRTKDQAALIMDDGTKTENGSVSASDNTSIILDKGEGKGNCKKAIEEYIKSLKKSKKKK